MCPKPGMMLRITATASLAFASAVSVGTPRVQSHLSQCCASFARTCPQYGHGRVFPGGGSASVRGASVYSTFMRVIEGSQTERNSSSKENVAHGPRAARLHRNPSMITLETACPQAVRGMSDSKLLLIFPLARSAALRICDDLRSRSGRLKLRTYSLDLCGLLFYCCRQTCHRVFQFRDPLLLLLEVIEARFGLRGVGTAHSHVLPTGIDRTGAQ